MRGQLVCRVQRPAHHHAARHDADVDALPQELALADPERVAVPVDVRRLATEQLSQVHGSFEVNGRVRGLDHLAVVARVDHRHVRQRAHVRQIIDPLVGRAERRVDARQGSHDLHVRSVQRTLDRDEVERSTRGEHRERGGDRREPGFPQSDGNADQVLLGHPDVHEAFGERLGERSESGHAGDVGGQGDDVGSPLTDVEHRMPERPGLREQRGSIDGCVWRASLTPSPPARA